MQQRDFHNVKISSEKRKSYDSGLDDTYETPAKKVCIPASDSGCFVGSPSTISSPSSPDELKNKQPIVQTVNSSKSEKDSIASSGILPGLESSPDRSKKVALNLGPAFDFDVEEILCLSPIKKCSCPTGVGNHLSCQVVNSKGFQNKPVEDQCPTPRNVVGGDGRECLSKTIKGAKQDAVGENVYFSRRYLETMRMGKDCARLSASPVLAHTTSRLPVHRLDESKVFQGESSVCQQQVSFTLNDISSTVSMAPLVAIEGTVEALEGDVNDAWNIGCPMSESSMLSTDCEKERSFLDTPLKVQVKSEEVVLPIQKTESSEPSHAVPDSSPYEQSQRSVVLDSNANVLCEWQQYVQKVRRHIDESKVSEEQDQESSATSGHQGQQSQHPPDVTASATVMLSADCGEGVDVGEVQGDVTVETSFEDTSYEDTPVKVQMKSEVLVAPSRNLQAFRNTSTTATDQSRVLQRAGDQRIPNSATVMLSADCGEGVDVGEVQGDVTVETSFEDTSYEDTPVKVQVKSEVLVAPSRNLQAFRNTSTTATDQSRVLQRAGDQRIPNRYFFNADYHREKQQYVWTVRRHMEENLGAMAELQNMMHNVANRGWHSASSQHWQHPSDLTVRNYQRQFVTRVRSLDEWQAQNYGRGAARFYTTPDVFQRCPVVFR